MERRSSIRGSGGSIKVTKSLSLLAEDDSPRRLSSSHIELGEMGGAEEKEGEATIPVISRADVEFSPSNDTSPSRETRETRQPSVAFINHDEENFNYADDSVRQEDDVKYDQIGDATSEITSQTSYMDETKRQVGPGWTSVSGFR